MSFVWGGPRRATYYSVAQEGPRALLEFCPCSLPDAGSHAMLLRVIVDDQQLTLNVPDVIVEGAEDFFAQMDRDMDAGWQMGREWVDRLTTEQRCQVVANKLLTALETENDKLGRMMAAYILARMPHVETVEIDTSGEIQNTTFVYVTPVVATDTSAGATSAPPSNRLEALERAGREVTKVFKMGRQYRFAVLNRATGLWDDSPAIASEADAEAQRELAVKRRYEELVGTRH